MRKKLFLIPLFISLFLLGACSNNSTSQNSESSSNSSSVKTSKLVKSSSQKKSSSIKSSSSSSQSSSSSNEVASDSSNAIPSSSVSASSQSQDVTTDNNSVLTSFLNASGVQLGNGDIAFITGENNGMYEIEIRTQSPGSTAVTNLKGIYMTISDKFKLPKNLNLSLIYFHNCFYYYFKISFTTCISSFN